MQGRDIPTHRDSLLHQFPRFPSFGIRVSAFGFQVSVFEFRFCPFNFRLLTFDFFSQVSPWQELF
jgi:hypothetical protein